MAKKRIPISKSQGVDGKGNIQIPGGPAVLDLGDFDDIFGPLEQDARDEGPLDQFWSGLKESFSDRFKTKDVVRNFLRSAAPDGISNLMGFGEEAVRASRDIKDSLERTNASDLQYIAKRAQALLPQLKDYTPDGMYNDISQGLENKIDEYDYTIQSQRDQTPIRRAAKDKADDDEIKSALDNISLTDKLNHNRSEKTANSRHQQNRAEESVRDMLRTKRFDFIARSMGMAVDGIQQIAGYNDQVNYGFQRKGLELQFRTFLGIKELVKLNEANLELQARAYTAMIRNSSMTDYQKSKHKGLDKMDGPGGRGVLGKVGAGVANKTLANFLGGYGNDVKGRVSGDLSKKLSMAVMAMKMGQGAGAGLWDNKYKVAGNLAGDLGSDFLMNDIIPMLGRKAKPGLTDFSNKKLGGKHNQIGYYLDNMPAFMQEFVNNGQNQHGIKGKISKMISPYVPKFGLQDRTKSANFQTIDQPAQFNQMTQRTITDGIPGYLARLLQEVRMIRTGRDDVGREVFDITNGTFRLESIAHKSMESKIVPKGAIRAASSTINDTLNTMDGEGKLSPGARKALSERMLRDASTNKRFDPDEYIKSRGYAKDVSPEVAKELDTFFKTKFEYDDAGKMKDTSDNHKMRQELSKAFLDIRSVSRDPIKEIERIIESGHTEPLRAIGVIITEDGIDKINYPRIWELLRSEVTDGNPFAPGGDGNDPTKDDMSGSKGHKDFVGPIHPGMVMAFGDKALKGAKNQYGDKFNSASDQIRDMMNGGLPGFNLPGMGNALNSAKNGFDQFVGDLPDSVKQKKDYIVDGMGALTDLYSSFNPSQPVIKGIDFSNGNLIDVLTKKIITKPEDITGEVINKLGQTVVTAAEAAAGLLAPGGKLVVQATEDQISKVNQAITANSNGGAIEAADMRADPDSAESLNSQDWTMGPGEDAVITARGMAMGEYYDSAGKVITSIKDIGGDVFDKLGNIVITGKEFANGLWSKRTGKKFKPDKSTSRLLRLGKMAAGFSGRTTTGMIFGAAGFAGKAALGMAAKVFNFVVENQNAYMPGEQAPVLTRRQLTNGEYFDDKGKVVESFADVYSPLHDQTGELILQPDQYKELKNYDGSKHVLAKNKSIWGKLINRPLRAMRSWYMKKTKQYYSALGRKTLKVGNWIGKKTLGGFAKAGGAVLSKFFDKVEDPNVKAQIDATIMTSDRQTGALNEILEELKSQKKKEPRKGSWQDQKDKAGLLGAVGAGKDKDDDKETKEGFFKRGLKGLAGMFGKKDKDDDDGDGFDLGDAADAKDLLDGDGDDKKRKRRRGRRGRRGGRGGRLGRMGSKLSRVGSRMAGSRIGQSIGRVALRMGARVGGQMLVRGAVMAGTALAGLLSAPVLLGAAAIAATAGVAYLGYKRYESISGEFRELRFAQYGVDKPVEKSFTDDVTDMSLVSFGGDKKKILGLEGLLEQHTDKESATPTLNLDAAGGEEILKVMGISVKDEAQVMVFARWMEKRFKPIFLAWRSGLFKLGKPELAINDVDDKLPNELKADFLEIIKFPYTGETPYSVRENPFSAKYELPDNTETIIAMFDKLTEKYNKERKDAAKADSTTPDNAAIKSEADKGTGADGAKSEISEASIAAGAAAGTADAIKAFAEDEKKDANAKADLYGAPGSIAAATVGVSSLSGNVTLVNQRISNTLTALQAIRMRAYGMQTLGQADVKAVLSVEAEYAKDLVVTPNSVDYNGDDAAFFTKAGELMGYDTSVGSEDRPKLLNWLQERFGPAFRAYYGAAKNAQPSASLTNIETKLTGSERIIVANAILGATTGSGASIWEIASIFDITGDPKDLKKMADADLAYLEKEAAKEVASSPTQKGSDQMAAKNQAESGGSFADKALSSIKETWNSAGETISTAWDKATAATGNAIDGAKLAIGMGPDYGEGGATGGVIKSAGQTAEVLAGNGGKWESIPMPTASGSAKAAAPTLKAVANMTGVPFDWLLVIAGIESSFKYTVKAETSTASGWFQFINSTWDEVYKRYGPKYGCPPDPNKTRAARNDPRINALMGAEYIRQNYNGLKKGLKRDNFTDVDVYMAHFLGLGGALKFFRADPNAMAYKVFSKEYSANMPLFFVKGKPGQPRTIAQLYKLFQDKIAAFWNTTGKGLREGGDNQVTAGSDVQAPGAEPAPKSEEDLAKERLAEDAKDKTGVAAQAEDVDSVTEPKESADSSQPTVASIANNTGPMPGAPATGGGAVGSSSTTEVGTDSGSSAVDEQRNTTLAQAQSNNTRRAEEVRQEQTSTEAVSKYNQKMLGTTMEIRDLMRTLIATIEVQQDDAADAAGKSGNNNNMTTQTITSRAAATRASSLTLK